MSKWSLGRLSGGHLELCWAQLGDLWASSGPFGDHFGLTLRSLGRPFGGIFGKKRFCYISAPLQRNHRNWGAGRPSWSHLGAKVAPEGGQDSKNCLVQAQPRGQDRKSGPGQGQLSVRVMELMSNIMEPTGPQPRTGSGRRSKPI